VYEGGSDGLAPVDIVNIFVCIKPQIRGREVAYAADTGQPLRPATVQMGETDDVALQAALDLSSQKGGAVTVISAADERADALLKHCLERGAARALRVAYSPVRGESDTGAAARMVAGVVGPERADLIFCASRSGDLGSGFFPYAIASEISGGLVTRVIELDLTGEGITAVRKLERGWRERYELELPAVIAVEDELARPRHVPVLGRSHRQAMDLPVECRAAAVVEADGERSTALLEVALTVPQPRRRPVARAKPRGTARDRLRRKRPTASGDDKTGPVRLDGDPEAIGRQLLTAIRGWLEKSKDEPSS
jgi:electron transfer flavoprotein alpha/beta subunit